MKKNAQSLMEFAIILMSVTIVAIVSLQIISNKINSADNNVYNEEQLDENTTNMSSEEADCLKMGLSWDKQNGLCEAK